MQSSKRGLFEVAYEHVKLRLFESHYLPGDWLPIDEIAAELKMSRQPVLESIKRLSMDGFVLIVPQVGCQVRSYRADEIQDFYGLFAAGEGLTAEWAALRADREDLVRLRLISQQIGALPVDEDPPQALARMYRRLNRLFHTEIRRIARSPTATAMVERMGDLSDFFVASSGRPFFAETLQAAHHEHEHIVSAIERHDSYAAGQATRTHIESTNTRLQLFLRSPRLLTDVRGRGNR